MVAENSYLKSYSRFQRIGRINRGEKEKYVMIGGLKVYEITVNSCLKLLNFI